MSSNDDGLVPSWNKSGNVLNDDGFSEDSTVQLVSDGSVGGLPHLLKTEFLNSSFIRGDGGALDTDLALLDGSSGVQSDLIIGLITILHAEVKVLDVNVQIGNNELRNIKE